MLVRRRAFLDVGGFDEAFGISYNDVDLCLRLRSSGWRIVWTPEAELYHTESASIGPHDLGETKDQWTFEQSLIRDRWRAALLDDPCYNPNLSLEPSEVWEPAFPPRVLWPWRESA
jgi:GT2 family glycosyltransferase